MLPAHPNWSWHEYGMRVGFWRLRKMMLKLALVPRWLTSADFRLAFTSGVSANMVCFERELLDHYRLVFSKTAPDPTASSPSAPGAAT